MLKKIFHMVAWLLLAIFFVVTLAFTSMETKDIKCSEVSILYDEDQLISIDQREVFKMVYAADAKLLEKKLNQINAEAIEEEVEKHLTIENAEVYTVATKDTGNYKGILTVKITHREPLFRVVTSAGSYYLDAFGEKFPVSINYSANVLVASGTITEKYAKNTLLPFVKDIEKNDFWKAQIEQVFVSSKGEVSLIPLVGDHVIELGTVTNYKEKLSNLKAFYEQALANGKWNMYKQISLKYKNQVIGTKR